MKIRKATGGTKVRTVRIDDELWERAKAQAAQDGTDVSALIRMWLTVYVRPRKRRYPEQRQHASP